MPIIGHLRKNTHQIENMFFQLVVICYQYYDWEGNCAKKGTKSEKCMVTGFNMIYVFNICKGTNQIKSFLLLINPIKRACANILTKSKSRMFIGFVACYVLKKIISLLQDPRLQGVKSRKYDLFF